MPRERKSRKLEVYALHCRNENTPVDYVAALRRIARAPLEARQFQLTDRLVVLPSIRLSGDVAEIIAYEGPLGVNPLIFDAGTGDERYESLENDQIIATRTYGIVDLAAKEAIVEYNHRGAKAADIALVLEEAGKSVGLGEKFTVEIVPIADTSFLAALDRFGRIKAARLKVAEPNLDWNDNYEAMNEVGRDSHARTVELIAVASRTDTLSRENGVVNFIRQMVARGVRNLKGAAVEGIRVGETADTRISLANFVQHQKVNLRIDQHGHVIGEDIQTKLKDFLRERRAHREQ